MQKKQYSIISYNNDSQLQRFKIPAYAWKEGEKK